MLRETCRSGGVQTCRAAEKLEGGKVLSSVEEVTYP